MNRLGKLLTALLLFAITASTAQAKITLWTCGDSTMADYATDGSTPTRGWCQFIDAFFEGDIQVINKGKGGQDTHSFINLDAYWPYIKKNLKAGDYVLLQFAHNDEKNNGMDGYDLRDYYLSVGKTTEAAAVDLRGSVPSGSYIEMLEDLVKQIRAAGAYPIFASSICRFYFDGKDIKRNGRHDLGDSYQVLTAEGPKAGTKLAATDHTMDYRWQMENLAKKLDVPFIDMTEATRQLYLKYGEANCKTMIGNGEDGTHLGVSGAVIIGRLGAQLMKEANILTDYINLGGADISFNPSNGELGEAYIGNIINSELTLTGFNLEPAAGTVSLSVTDGFQLSTDKTNWGKTASIAYDGGTLIGTLYVRATLENPGTMTGTITATAGSKTSTLSISAIATPLPGSGKVSATWPLTSNDKPALEGEAEIVSMKLVGLKATYNNGINLQPENGTWPSGDIDESPTRYIEFGIRPTDGKVLQLNNLSMNITSPDTDLFQCHVNYSLDPTFSNPRTFWSPAAIEKGKVNAVSTSQMINVPADGVLLLRVYPWAKSEVSNANFRIADVNIAGYSVNAALETVVTWTLGQGANDPVAAETSTNKFAYTALTVGSDLTVQGTGTYNTAPCTLYQPKINNQSGYTDAGAVNFTIAPKAGVTFQPTKISFYGTRIGTDGGKLQVSLEYGDKRDILGTDLSCIRNNTEPKQTFFEFPISGAVVFGEPMTLHIAISALGNSKQIAIRDVRIEGEISGTPEAVPTYSYTLTQNYPEAGTVSINPATETVDRNTTVTLAATENFGYTFSAWEANGKVISTENPYAFQAQESLDIKAVYVKHNVYPLNLTVTGGANDYMVTINPAGTIIDGQRWYVEGDNVILTPVSNPALTFTNWEDNTTALTREIKIEGETNVIANFAAADYIVGWDLTLDDPKSNRTADLKAESDNAGMLCLRNAAGQTTGWLGKGLASGTGDFGRFAARVWKNLTDKYYFEITFSAKEYTNLKVISAIQHSFNTYGTFLFQCSTDGEDFTTVGTASPAFKAWTDTEFELPASCNGAERVWFRWYPDFNADLIGSASDYDGLTLSGIYVMGEFNAADDNIAPVMTASVPADGFEGASTSGSIILTYDEKIKLGQGKATLDGKELTPTIAGKSVVFPYNSLSYNTQYTFTMTEGLIVDRSGNKAPAVNLTFTTMQRSQPDAKTFDAIVDCNGQGDYTTLQAAIDAAPEDRTKPWLILVLNGNYKEHINIPANKPFMHIIGQEREKTVVLDDKLCGGDNAVHVSVGATVVVNANDCFFENITLENSYGHEKQAGPQALALNTIGDRVILNNVALLSYQDTWITTSNSAYRAYVKDSFIEGAVDFIYNSGDLYCENTTLYINRKDGGFIVAPSHGEDVKWGYVFRDCTITAPGNPAETSVWLGRPWHGFPKTVFLNTKAEVTIPATGWYETMGGLPAIWADWNTTDAKGNLIDLSQRRSEYYVTNSDGTKTYGTAKNRLTDEEAAEYTISNVLSGADAWQPAVKVEACEAPAPTAEGNTIVWDAVPYAICYLVTEGDNFLGVTTDNRFDLTRATRSITVQAVNEFGGLSAKTTVKAETELTEAEMEAAEIVAIYDMQGRRLARPVEGLNLLVKKTATGRLFTVKSLHRNM